MLRFSICASIWSTSVWSVNPSDFHSKYDALKAGIQLSREEAEWLEVIGQGWTDRKGFMREEEYLRSVHYQQPPVPVVLSCDLPLDWKESVGLVFDYSQTSAELHWQESEKVASAAAAGKADGDPVVVSNRREISGIEKTHRVAILHNVEVFEHRKEERAARTFGLTHKGHPYVGGAIYSGQKNLCGGDLEILTATPLRDDGLDKYRETPDQLREFFFGGADRKQENSTKFDAVFAFQLRNPIHNGHALLMKDTHQQLLKQGYKRPCLWINPLGGWTKDDDVPLLIRMRQHEKLLQNKIFGKDLPVKLSIFPSPMLYAGPREVQWHALARQSVGATHYIVGRDPAGMKHPVTQEDIYLPWDGQKMLKMNPDFNMKIVPFQFAAYNKVSASMEFFDPAKRDNFISISGTKMRAMATKGETPPKGFMDPDGWDVLWNYYREKQMREKLRTEL